MAKSVQDLAQALSETERKELLDRIQRSLSLNTKQNQVVVRGQTSAEQREHLILEGIHQLGIIQRVHLWVKKLFSSKTLPDIFIDMKLEDTAKALVAGNIIEPKGRIVNIGFPAAVYQLYLMVIPVKRFLNIIWENEQTLRSAVQFVLEQRIPKARSTLYDFIPANEVQDLFETAESKTSIRQELMNRVNQYLDNIPAEIFSELELALMPLYNLRQLCFFEYYDFFRLFQADPASLEKGTPRFTSAPADKVMGVVEELFYAIHSAKKAVNLDSLPPQLFKYVQMRRFETEKKDTTMVRDGMVFAMAEPDEPETPKDKEISDAVADEGLRQLRKELKQLQEQLTVCLEKSRIAEVIKYFQNDPYYRILAYSPSINLKDFYLATLRIKLLQGLDEQFVSIRQMVVDNIKKQLFPQGVKELEFFKRFPAGTPRAGLPGFRYVQSMTLFNSFLVVQYAGQLREVFRMLIKILPNRNRDVGSELLFHSTAVEGLFDKVKALDAAFSPDSDEGKAFIRMKVAMDKDLAQERQYRSFIAQNDKDCRDVLEEGIEHVRALAEALHELSSIPAALLGERFSVAAGSASGSNFSEFLKVVIARLKGANRLIRYQRALDDETSA